MVDTFQQKEATQRREPGDCETLEELEDVHCGWQAETKENRLLEPFF